MARRQGWRGFLSGMLLDNWKNKGAALFLAIVVWGYAFGSTQEEKKVVAQVRLQPRVNFAVRAVRVVAGDSVGPGSAFPGEVSLTLFGQRRVLQNLDRLFGDLPLQDSLREYRLDDTSLYERLPAGIVIRDADPRVIRVEVEPMETVTRPIQARPTGTPDSRFARVPRRIEVDPPELQLVGPESALAEADPFVAFDLAEVDQPSKVLSRRVTWNDGGGRVRLLDGTGIVQVRVELEDATQEREFEVPLLFPINNRRAVEVEATDRVKVRFRGTESGLEALAQRLAERRFYLLFPINLDQPGAQNVLESDLTWPRGTLPPGVDYVGYSDDQPGVTASVVEVERGG